MEVLVLTTLVAREYFSVFFLNKWYLKYLMFINVTTPTYILKTKMISVLKENIISSVTIKLANNLLPPSDRKPCSYITNPFMRVKLLTRNKFSNLRLIIFFVTDYICFVS